MSSFHTVSHGPDRTALRRSLMKLVEVAQTEGGVGYIATHVKNNIHDAFPEIMDERLVNELLRAGSIAYMGIELRFLNERTTRNYTGGPLLCAHVSSNLLSSLERLCGASSIIYVPWMPEELESYVLSHPDSTAI